MALRKSSRKKTGLVWYVFIQLKLLHLKKFSNFNQPKKGNLNL